MKKITEEEFLNLTRKGRGKSSPLFNAVFNLQLNEAIVIEKKEWHRKRPPHDMVRKVEKKYQMKFSVVTLDDDSGWAIKRVS